MCSKDPSRKRCPDCSRPRRLVALEQLQLEIGRNGGECDEAVTDAPEPHKERGPSSAESEARRLTPSFF